MIVSLILTLSFVSDSLQQSDINRASIEAAAKEFERKILQDFETISKYSLAKEGFDSVIKPKLSSAPVDIGPLAQQFLIKLQPFFDEKIDALRRMTRAAEEAASGFLYPVRLRTQKAILQRDTFLNGTRPAYLDAKAGGIFFNETTRIKIDRTGSLATHVPVEVFEEDPSVERDLKWTNSRHLASALISNAQATSGILRQYISTDTGISSMYPPKPWRMEPDLITVDLYDPRFRIWYVSAVSAPKDIMFLLDYSGSVYGQTLRLMKLTVAKILSFLTPNDYVNAVWYNKTSGLVMKDCFDGFLPATSRNKMLLQRYLDQITPSAQARLPQALNYTFMEIKKIDENRSKIWEDNNHRSGGHQLLMLFTDGIEDWSESVINHYAPPNNDQETRNTSIRIFGMAIGFGTGYIDALRWMACSNKGYYSLVNSFTDVKIESRSFISVISRPLALTLQNVDVFDRPVSWTGPYMDAQGEGSVLTLSMPIRNTMLNGSAQSFLGVAAIDIKMSSIERLIDSSQLGPDAYTFAADNNGLVLFHPELKHPEPDIQLIRRTACFDAANSGLPGKGKFSGDSRVMFTATNEATVRQMGLLDSISLLDVTEIEHSSDKMAELRRQMIDQTCTTQIFTIGSHSYTCRSIRNTPISIAVAARINAKTSDFNDRRTSGDLNDRFRELTTVTPDDMVGRIFPPKVLCSGTLDFSTLTSDQRSTITNEVWPNHIDAVCALDGDGPTKRLLGDFEASATWREAWTKLPENSTCTDMLPTADMPHFRFVQTASGLTFLYPKICRPSTEDFREVPESLKWGLERSEFYRFNSPTPSDEISLRIKDKTVLITKPILSGDVVMAVVGYQVSLSYMDDYWMNFTFSDRRMKDVCTGTNSDHELSGRNFCRLLNRKLKIIASTSDRNKDTLGHVDPSLFDNLFNYTRAGKRVIDMQSVKDFQAVCPREDRPNLFISGANPLYKTSRSLLKLFSSFFSFLTTCIWVELWNFATAVGGMVLPEKETIFVRDCQDKWKMPVADEENCVMTKHSYTLKTTLTTIERTATLPMCSRKYVLVAVGGTNIWVMVAGLPCRDKSCASDCYKSKLPVDPERVPECDEIRIRYRRRPEAIYTKFHPDEDDSLCGLAVCQKISIVVFLACLLSRWLF